jgi:ribose/xylose/arabinose/galactoside ABC-type transport system permease subunit
MIAGLPRPFLNFAQIEISGMPSLFFVWLVVIVLSIVITTLTRFARNVFAIGSNPEACPTQWHQHPLNPFILQIAIGGLIVASVLIDQLSKRQNA